MFVTFMHIEKRRARTVRTECPVRYSDSRGSQQATMTRSSRAVTDRQIKLTLLQLFVGEAQLRKWCCVFVVVSKQRHVTL